MKRLLVAGGDQRALCLAELLEADGYRVETLGLRENEEVHIDQADAVLLPYPFSVKNGCIPVLTEETIQPERLLKELKEKTLLITGRGMEAFVTQESLVAKRYSDAADFEYRNAQLSAEAAVLESMLHSRMALMDSSVLVTGYGLFGRAIALRLKSLGADVWIAARREEQRKQACMDGMKAVSIVDMADMLPQTDLILNTVPARIFGEYHLRRIPKDCWLLELASAPYGFDAELARAMGVSSVKLPGLPARYSPKSAALALYAAVKKLIGEGGR